MGRPVEAQGHLLRLLGVGFGVAVTVGGIAGDPRSSALALGRVVASIR